MFYIRIFSFIVGLVPNLYDYVKFLVRLRLTYVSPIIHLSEMAWSSKVNQFTCVS